MGPYYDNGDMKNLSLLRFSHAMVYRLVCVCVFFIVGVTAVTDGWPSYVKIGCLLASNVSIGYGARVAAQMALQDINNNSTLLNGTVLDLHYVNTQCNAFQGAAAAMELLEQKVVAIMGPQSSEVAHFVAHMAATTQVPLISASATDPTLSEHQFPYFIRLARSDRVQMGAVASIIGLYGWREVVAIYTDDDYGTNGIDTLEDALVSYGANIVHKAPVNPSIDKTGLSKMLAELAQMGTRIFVVHMQAKLGLELFSEAFLLRMVDKGYVWITTEAITSALDTVNLDNTLVQATCGVIGTRTYIPDSPELQFFKKRWRTLADTDTTGLMNEECNAYDVFAYDSVWMIAHAVRDFLWDGGNFTFVSPTIFQGSGAGTDLARLEVFLEGERFLRQFKELNFTGLSGTIRLDKRGDPVGTVFEVVNKVGKGLRTVGYCSNATGCFTSPPLANETFKENQQKLNDVIWPGNDSGVPRGWMLPKNGRALIIGVPNKEGYKEFVDASGPNNSTVFHGFCIDVFEAARSYLPYSFPYTFRPYGNGTATPSYDELVQKVANKEFDAVVGDITITTKRAKLVDFTQPYTTSGLVVVVPVRKGNSNHAWAFMRPFTPALWCTTVHQQVYSFFLLEL